MFHCFVQYQGNNVGN